MSFSFGVRSNGVLAHDVGPDDTDLVFDPPAFDYHFKSDWYVGLLTHDGIHEFIRNGKTGILRGMAGTPAREWAEGTPIKIVGIVIVEPPEITE